MSSLPVSPSLPPSLSPSLSSGREVRRPVVRSFNGRHLREASAHVRAGGHAAVWEAPEKGLLVLPVPVKGDASDLALWSILDLGRWRWTVAKAGAFKGLATMRIPKDCNDIVRRRAERDSILEGPMHTVLLDCLACGACCRDNKVVIDEDDMARFVAANRRDLLKRPYAKRDDGKLVLTLRKDKACHHLAADNKCGIYEIRPEACSSFPMASECCLFAREEELGIVDGLADA